VPQPRNCLPFSALVAVTNELDAVLKLQLAGPEEPQLAIPAGEKARYCLVPGEYRFTASAPGYSSETGSRSFAYDPGDCVCWWWTPSGSGMYQPYRPCNCPTDPGQYGPAPLKAGAKPWSLDKASAHCANRNVCVILPAPGATISGNVYVIGTANIENLQRFKMEWWGQGATSWAFLLEKDTPVVNGELMMLNSGTVPAGRYGLRLTVIDRAGNYPEPFEIWWTIQR
jgi:hypothetical protein